MMHFGRYSFNEDAIDYIELNGDGSYTVHIMRGYKFSGEFRNIDIKEEEADALREWIDADKKAIASAHAIDEYNARRALGGEIE